MSASIIPYTPYFDEAISHLEASVVQGRQVQLRMLKDHFLSRSSVFSEYSPCLAVDNTNQLLGASVGAKTKMIVNGQLLDAGFVYDAKVHPSHRNKGVGRLMAKHHKEWFSTEGLKNNFTTLKLSNAPVIQLSAKAIGNIWLYDFVYLTIPTAVRVEKTFVEKTGQKFFVKLFNGESVPTSFYTFFDGNLGCFHTYQLYRLKIEKLSWFYKHGLSILKKVNPQKYQWLPGEQEVMDFAVLYNHCKANITNINKVLKHLKAEGKKFLLVCCRKNDDIYRYLEKYSINTYGYFMLADFPLYKNDEVTIDVRCL